MKYRKIHYAWIILAGCCLFSFLAQGMILGTIGTYMTSIAESLNVGQTQISMAMTFEMLGMAVAMPIVGSLMRKVNFRALVTCSVAAATAGLTLASFANSVVLLYVAWTVIGAAVSVTLLLPVLVGNWFSEKLGLAMGISTAIASAGSAVFNPLVSILIKHAGWRGSYRISAVILLVLLTPVALFFLRLAPGDGETPYGYGRAAADSSAPAAGADDGLTFGQALGTPLFYIILIGTALFSAFSAISQQIVPHLVSQGFDGPLAASVLSCTSVGSATGKLLIGPMLDGRRRNGAIMGFAALVSAGWIVLALTPGMALTFLGGIMCGLGQCTGMVAIPYLSRRFFGGKDMGKITGVSGALCTLVPAVAVVVSGAVFDKNGSYAAVFFFAGVVSLVTMAMVLAAYLWSMAKRTALEGAC